MEKVSEEVSKDVSSMPQRMFRSGSHRMAQSGLRARLGFSERVSKGVSKEVDPD